MSSAFDKWYAENGQRFDYDDALEVWNAAERQTLERAIQAIDESGARPMDIAAIRALTEKDVSKDKQHG
ncbi:hypothetical protein [Caballeronia sp. AZ10_KS36]|uniref:hypothetical protein n=1 Tax=Caballeronia sp. AZ10_KS36 TaxID=2921757 RepID=UPI002028AE8C|nr:hypothetical protein [Caballeronia sp. AZ10_KS36]